LDILLQSHRDKKAAKKFFRKLLKTLRYVPRLIVTDKLRSYSAATAEVMLVRGPRKGQNKLDSSHRGEDENNKIMAAVVTALVAH
jgi:putative transposase